MLSVRSAQPSQSPTMPWKGTFILSLLKCSHKPLQTFSLACLCSPWLLCKHEDIVRTLCLVTGVLEMCLIFYFTHLLLYKNVSYISNMLAHTMLRGNCHQMFNLEQMKCESSLWGWKGFESDTFRLSQSYAFMMFLRYTTAATLLQEPWPQWCHRIVSFWLTAMLPSTHHHQKSHLRCSDDE